MRKRRKSPVQIETTEAHMCSLDMRLRILRGVPFFHSLGDEALEQVNSLFKERGFAPGETLYFMGDPAHHLFVVAEGRVRLLRHTAGGKQVMLDLLVPGDFFGALGQGQAQYPDTAQAQTAVCALTIAAEDFRRVLQAHPEAALAVMDALTGRLQTAHDAIHLLSTETAEKRVAYILLKLARKLGKTDQVGLLIQTPLGRDELADMAGITPETASRVISQFQKEGWITTGRQWVALTDADALQEIVSL